MFPQLLPHAIRFLERSQTGRTALRAVRRWKSRPNRLRPKVLCIGNLKTGTSSFGVAMRRLGYSHFGFDYDMAHDWLPGNQLNRCLSLAEHFDSFDDLPWSDPRLVHAFARRFPNTRFVLLERALPSWIVSWRRHFARLGQPVMDTDEQLTRRYHDHNSRVLQAVSGYGEVLRMNVCAGEGYEVLCPFLQLPPLQEPFPKVNVQEGHKL